jgi:hypothetical protein
MALTLDLLRPDDLLVLKLEARNLRLDTTDPKKPRLVVDKAAKPAFLIVTFPPQSIAEKAYFEVAANVTDNPPFNQVPPPPPLGSANDPLDPAGKVPARMTGPSRLVFQLPKNLTSIPYRMDALLDWSKLELVVSATALGKNLALPIPKPSALETAIELPYRLILSPGSGVAWVNALRPVTHSGRTELWHTRLARIPKGGGTGNNPPIFQEASPQKPIPLRAIWSPDFIDHASLPSHALDEVPFLGAMSPRDRAQIVILTSGVTGYFVLDSQHQASPWVPVPVQASRLMLSALGGWLTSRGRWSPLPNYFVEAGGDIALLPQSLDLGEWSHIATQGRDQYVRIVYEGFLYPFGHRASLVKVTERKVVPPDGGVVTSPTAYLKQHMYIVVREPEKSYDPGAYDSEGREMPFYKRVRINTKVTPDLDKPVFISNASFWVKVGGANFQFHLTGEDLAGSNIDFLAKMIFVSNSETNVGAVGQSSPANSIKSQYLASGNERLCEVRGRKVAYADPGAGDTILKTTGLFFDTQVLFGPPFPSAPFIPKLDQATISVPSLEQLLGTSDPVTIGYFPDYLSKNLDSNAGVFAEILDATPPNVRFTADRAGGFATPNMLLKALSARKGLIAGDPADAAAGLIDPAAFFGNVQVEAKLFGTIPLGNLIPIDKITKKAAASKNAPEIRTKALPNHKHPTQFVTKVNWLPDLTDYSEPPIEIQFNSDGQASSLSLKANITRQLDGSPPQSSIDGLLSNFTISLLGVIGIKITSIKFSSKNGSKTNVVAKLANKGAIEFIGPLHFIQTLAEILPPGIFGGSGPAIDLKPTGIRVAYTLGLPPIGVGVFSLEHIAITTGLDLPYLDGKPAFEFAFASRKSPFLITVECLGGGGFVHLVLDADGIRMVEGALEFGGKFSFDIGVASGGIHIMAGIYFQLKGSDSDLSGFVDLGGELSVLGIISISIDLNLTLSYIHTSSGDKVQGRATLTISVHILFFSVSVSVSVERSFGSGKGDPRLGDIVSANDWADYALAFAS